MQFTAEMEQQNQKNTMAEALGKPRFWVVQSKLKNNKMEEKIFQSITKKSYSIRWKH